MDSDTVDASNLSSVSQPLDVLRLELQSEPAFVESDIPNDDYTLTRFLKARGYNASQAKQMILDCIQWRHTVEEVGIEELYRSIDPFDFPGRQGVFESWPMGFHKTDKRGRPIHIQSFGAISSKRLYKHITPQEHWRTVLVNIEAILAEIFPAASAVAGRPIRQALIIVDLKGFGLSQFWTFKSIARRFFQVSQNHYPETMGQLIIINAPTSFTTIWSAIKPWLAPRTLDKISILGASQPDQHATLLDLVPPENLPVALGGTCTCSSTDGTDGTNSTNSITAGSRSDSDVDSDSDSCSGSSTGGGGGGCALSNAGPWMDGRAERRARWLRGEIPKPGVPWPPLQKQEEQAELEEEGHAVEETGGDENVEEAKAGPIDARVASAGSSGVAAAPPSISASPRSRTSVVGLPPLTHPPPPAPVRLVV